MNDELKKEWWKKLKDRGVEERYEQVELVIAVIEVENNYEENYEKCRTSRC